MQHRKMVNKLASKILENRVSMLFPTWVMKGCPYAERIISNFTGKKDPFEDFDDYEVNDALAFCVYIRTNSSVPEDWDPLEEAAERVEQGIIARREDSEKYLAKYIGDLISPKELAEKFKELSGMIHFDPEQKHAAFFRKS